MKGRPPVCEAQAGGYPFSCALLARVGTSRLQPTPASRPKEPVITTILLLASLVLVACVALSGASAKLGVPSLLLFILLGMLVGVDGPFHVAFDDYALVGDVCSAALVLIMFYGGFGTSWRQARPVAARAVMLSTVGVVATAGLTGVFCHVALGFDWTSALLLGAVVASTDAASVFSILRSRKLALREGTASLLEVESGSNDPMAYLMTMVLTSAFAAPPSAGQVAITVFLQVGLGLAVGFGVALAVRWLLSRREPPEGMGAVLMVGVAFLAYALASWLGGNGYLACYLAGLVLGNGELPHKESLVHFFDGMTEIAQVAIFFLLGLLSTPTSLPPYALPALAVVAFLTLVARPVAVASLLLPMGSSPGQVALVSFSGLRGAASIVFSILAMTGGAAMGEDIFHMTFFIVLVSILAQGTALPAVARRLGMVDDKGDVMRTFTDYQEERDVRFIESSVPAGHPWAGRTLSQIELPPGTLVAFALRDGRRFSPDGSYVVQAGDALVLASAGAVRGLECACDKDLPQGCLREVELGPDDPAIGRKLKEASRWHQLEGALVVMVLRGETTIVPNGSTVLEAGDVLVVSRA